MEPITCDGRAETLHPQNAVISHHINESYVVVRVDDASNLAFWLDIRVPKEQVLAWAKELEGMS